jgi:hypothetical protein
MSDHDGVARALWFVYDAAAPSVAPALWVPAGWNQYHAVLWRLLVLGTTFPSAYMAWTEPDLPSSEQGEHAGRPVPGSHVA